MENLETQGFYDFGTFRLDAENRLLWRANADANSPQPIALTLKEFEILLALVENAGRVIKKDELLETIWKDTFVEEGTLTRNISRLRKKLEAATGEGEQFIETLPKRGYRFLPSVVKTSVPAALLVVEEQVRMRVRVEEFEEEETGRRGEGEIGRSGEREFLPRAADAENKFLASPNVPPSPLRPVSPSHLLGFALGALAVVVVGFVVYQTYSRRSEPRTILANRVTPFSGATGREDTPAFSPDGKQLAFAWDGGDGGDADVYVRLVSSIEPVRLTDTELNEYYPTFSPDGAHIAFIRDFKTHGEVVLIPTLGGAERRVARLFSGNFSISFAPDGNELAVVDTADSIAGENKQYAVYTLNLQTDERRRLTAPAEFIGETTPRFAPDGKSLAFVRLLADKNQDLFVVPVTKDDAPPQPRRITDDKATVHSLAWSADGQKIFFVSLRGGNQPNVWCVATTKGSEPEKIAAGGREITNLAVAPDSKTIAFVENRKPVSIWSAAGNGIPTQKFAASIYGERDGHFSPDNRRVAFASGRLGKQEIWVADAESGKNLRQITDSATDNADPRFSPDGAHIVYTGAPDGNLDLFVAPTEGGAARRLTANPARDSLPAWSADGRWIYFTSDRGGENQLWRIPASGGEAVEAKQITRGGGVYEAMPAPDGASVYYSTRIGNESELWRVPIMGGTEESLPEFTHARFIGIWTMTARGIYFLPRRQPEESFELKFYGFADKKIKDAIAVSDVQTANKDYFRFDATDDGSRFLYSVFEENASSIMLAELSE